MAAFDHIQNMYDISLKPRLLRSLIKEHIPDEKHPFRNPLELLHVVSAVKTHRLLSESAAESTDQKIIHNWKAAVDAWVNRLLMLVSSNMPDKCWAGICLLGITCQECGSERFLASYSVWFHKLLSNIQPPAESHFVKVASCASISDLFTRLGGFLNVKKDGTSHATKLIQPVLKLLNEDDSAAVWEGAVCLLCTIITFFPSSVHRHYDAAEAAIVSKIMSGKCSSNMLKKLGHCLALIPKSKGDEDSWSLMLQKILLSINVHLNDAFQGVEQENKSNEAMRVLVPPGKDPPPPLGGQTMLETPDHATKRPERLLTSTVSTLMSCCCTMLTSSYPVQISVPIKPLMVLAGRVLMVDGSLSQALYPFMTSMQQEFICSELRVLHLHSLELLIAIIKGVRSQLLPHAADIVRLLTEYFRRCAMPELRIKVYSIIKIMLMSMGVGMALCLTQEVINSTFVDLDSCGHDNSDGCSNVYSKVPSETLIQPLERKRKHETTIGSLEEHPNRIGLEVTGPKNVTPISVKIAALEALEALLTVGGALRSESWRSNVDRLLITVATNACKGGWAKEDKNVFLCDERTLTWADYQLAAMRALLASLLSPARVRPPYLAQGLELFRRGMQETGTKLAEFCAHALLALEVLIHPRALPLVDFASDSNDSFDGVKRVFPENIHSDVMKLNTSYSVVTLGKVSGDLESYDDDLYESWLGIGDEIDVPVPVADPGKNVGDAERPSITFRDSMAEKIPSVLGSSSTEVPEDSEMGAAAAAVKMVGGSGDEIMIDTEQFEETVPREGQTVAVVFGGSMDAQSGRVVSDSGVLNAMDSEMASREDVSATKGDGFTAIGEKPSTTTSHSEKSKGFAFELDDESSIDSIPDIVDGDPDSD